MTLFTLIGKKKINNSLTPCGLPKNYHKNVLAKHVKYRIVANRISEETKKAKD